jgi:hypothetical protein
VDKNSDMIAPWMVVVFLPEINYEWFSINYYRLSVIAEIITRNSGSAQILLAPISTFHH